MKRLQAKAYKNNLYLTTPKATTKRLVAISAWKSGRLFDQSNFIQACKALLDSLQPWAIKDDSLPWCDAYYYQNTAKQDNHLLGTRVLVYNILDESKEVSIYELR